MQIYLKNKIKNCIKMAAWHMKHGAISPATVYDRQMTCAIVKQILYNKNENNNIFKIHTNIYIYIKVKLSYLNENL